MCCCVSFTADTLVDSGSDAFSDADSDVDSEDVDNSDDDDAIGATDVAVIAVERGKDADVDVLMTAAEEDILLRCALCAGLFPQIIRAVDVSVNGSSRFVRTPSGSQGQQDGVKKRTKLVQGDGQDVVLHPSSLLCGYETLEQQRISKTCVPIALLSWVFDVVRRSCASSFSCLWCCSFIPFDCFSLLKSFFFCDTV